MAAFRTDAGCDLCRENLDPEKTGRRPISRFGHPALPKIKFTAETAGLYGTQYPILHKKSGGDTHMTVRSVSSNAMTAVSPPR